MVNQITPGGPPVAPTTVSPQPAVVRSAPRAAAGQQPAVVAPGVQAAAVAQVNQHLAQTQSDLKLQVDADSGRTVIQVIQQGTGQVLLQVPSEEVLGLSRRVRELLSKNGGPGALVDKEG